MNDNERKLIEELRVNGADFIGYFLQRYGRFITSDVLYNVRLGLISEKDQEETVRLIVQAFLGLVNASERVPDRYTIKQWLHLLVVSRAYNFDSTGANIRSAFREDSNWSEISDETLMRSGLLYAPLGKSIEKWASSPFAQPRSQALFVDSDERMTPRFLSAVLMPYVGAISSMQDVCNAVLGRRPREVTIKSITQNSPMSIKLIDAAEAFKALREDIVPWRRENAKNIARLKEQDIATDIMKKQEEALQIRARSIGDEAQAEKIRAEAAKIREEVEQLRVENDRRRFELQKAKLDLALEIVSKMQPDLPISERYTYAMALLPEINKLTTSEIEPALISE